MFSSGLAIMCSSYPVIVGKVFFGDHRLVVVEKWYAELGGIARVVMQFTMQFMVFWHITWSKSRLEPLLTDN
jgi:hypothetical protein